MNVKYLPILCLVLSELDSFGHDQNVHKAITANAATSWSRFVGCSLAGSFVLLVTMNTLTDTAVAAAHVDGEIVVRMESSTEIRFPIADNSRLARGTATQLNRIEISPFGLHWPELDEDLSFRGLQEGDFGQFQKIPKR